MPAGPAPTMTTLVRILELPVRAAFFVGGLAQSYAGGLD